MTPQTNAPGGRTPESRTPDFSWIAPLLGLLACVAGVFTALLGLLQSDISFEFGGIFLGTAGYLLGRRAFGAGVIAFSVLVMLLTLMMYVGYLPQLGPVNLSVD